MAKQKSTTSSADSDDAKRGVELALAALGSSAIDDTLKEQVDKLTPKQAAAFARELDKVLRKRRVMILGYVSALCALIMGLALALYVYGTASEGQFITWVFFVPFLLAAGTIWLFGVLSRRVD